MSTDPKHTLTEMSDLDWDIIHLADPPSEWFELQIRRHEEAMRLEWRQEQEERVDWKNDGF